MSESPRNPALDDTVVLKQKANPPATIQSQRDATRNRIPTIIFVDDEPNIVARIDVGKHLRSLNN
jgi:hypothetical protein